MSKTANVSKKKVKEPSPDFNEKYKGLFPLGIAILTYLIYSRITVFDINTHQGFDFLNWDDPAFVLGNTSITELSWIKLKEMFSQYYMGNYVPLSILTYAIDYNLGGGLIPKAFHISNLLFHVGSAVLIYYFVFFLSNRKVLVAVAVSLLFALHPMHVESVAWISERRDVLYTFFFMASLLSYLFYVDKGKRKYLLYSLLFFAASLLSKGQAVTLSVVVVLIDYLRNRPLWDKKVILEKIPFFVLSLIFGIVAVIAQRTTPAVNAIHLTPLQSFFCGFYSYAFYFFKAIIPVGLSGYHPYPFKQGESLPVYFYVFPFVVIGLGYWFYRFFRKDRPIVFGMLFFTLTIFPVLQFLPVGETIVSERYTYLPYIGLFFVLAYAANNAAKYKFIAASKTLVLFILFAGIGIYGIITFKRIDVFKDSISFWTDVIDKHPDSKIARNNRGYMYNELGQYDLAITDFNAGIAADGAYGRLYLNRGLSYERKAMYEPALADYNKSLSLDSSEAQPFINRGVIYADVLNKYDLALKDNYAALKREPNNFKAQTNIGVVFYKLQQYDSAIAYYSKAIAFPHVPANVYFYRALSHAAKKEFQAAIEDAKTAQQKGHNVDANLIKGWETAAGKGN